MSKYKLKVKSEKMKVSYRSLIVILSLVLGLVGLAGFARSVNAVNLSAGPLAISYDGTTVFSQSDVAPGTTYSKDITVTNNGTVAHSFALATTNVSGDLADQIYIEPWVDAAAVWKASVEDLSNLPTESKTIVSSIAPGASVVVTLKAAMGEAAGDAYQNKNVTFDIVFGTQEAEPGAGTFGVAGAGGSPTASPSLAISPSPSPSPGGGVLGEQTTGGSKAGKPWELLVVVPVAVMASFLLPLTMRTGVRTAAVAGAVSAAFASRYNGTIPNRTFWVLLVCEIVLIAAANYFLVTRLKRLIVTAEAEAAEAKSPRKRK